MRWHVYVAATLLSGCQAIQPLDETRASKDAVFVNSWKQYTHCQSSPDVTQKWQDAQQLNRTVSLMDQAARATRLLPDLIEQTLADPPPRFAVDPKAMAAACTLLAGQAAQDAGHSGFAKEMFSFVVANFAQPRYVYYREQAQLGLDRIEEAIEQVIIASTSQTPDFGPG